MKGKSKHKHTKSNVYSIELSFNFFVNFKSSKSEVVGVLCVCSKKKK